MAYGASQGDGKIYKYTLSRGMMLFLINNNSAETSAIVAVYKHSTFSHGAKVLFSTGSNWGSFWYDSSNNIYFKHSENWGYHTVIASTHPGQDGYVTSTTNLTQISVQS